MATSTSLPGSHHRVRDSGGRRLLHDGRSGKRVHLAEQHSRQGAEMASHAEKEISQTEWCMVPNDPRSIESRGLVSRQGSCVSAVQRRSLRLKRHGGDAIHGSSEERFRPTGPNEVLDDGLRGGQPRRQTPPIVTIVISIPDKVCHRSRPDSGRRRHGAGIGQVEGAARFAENAVL